MSEPAEPTTGPPERATTFREVMASREYRAVFSASALSWFGDYAARAAVTALVYMQTHSVAASAATFAISYLPWLGIGAVLSAVAERYSYRRVMIICDVVRLAVMAFIALAHLPVPALMALLFVTALLNPPFDSARSALLPQILDGDRYVVGMSLQKTIGQAAMIAGYVGGAALTAYNANLALLFNAATFGFSACAIGLGVHERPPMLRVEERTSLLRETAEGYSVVFRAPVLRAIAIIVFGGACFGIVPEGLAAAWAAQLTGSATDRGWFQGVIMMSGALGFIIGSLTVARLASPSMRVRLIRPFAIIVPLSLVPALFNPDIVVLVVMTMVCGIALAGMIPATNGLFVQALPPAFRARAFGVMQSGLHLIQGAAVTITGWLAGHFALHHVVGLWGVGGVLLMVLLSLSWPAQATINDAIAANRIRIAAEAHAGSPSGRDFGEDTIDLGRPAAPQRRPRPSRAAGPTPGYLPAHQATSNSATSNTATSNSATSNSATSNSATSNSATSNSAQPGSAANHVAQSGHASAPSGASGQVAGQQAKPSSASSPNAGQF